MLSKNVHLVMSHWTGFIDIFIPLNQPQGNDCPFVRSTQVRAMAHRLKTRQQRALKYVKDRTVDMINNMYLTLTLMVRV